MFKRLSTILLIFIMCLMTILPVSATSTDKVYRVDNLDVVISLIDDGDAVVTENWTLTYSKGEFSRFYKYLFTNGYYDDTIDILSVKINGEEVRAAEGLEARPHNTYEIGSEEGNTIIQWYHHINPSSPTVVEFSITYKLYNAVVLYSDNAYFRHQLIGTGFDKNIIKTTITVNTPHSIEFKIKDKLSSWKQNNNIIIIKNNNKSDLILTLKMDSNVFHGLDKCNWWSVKSLTEKMLFISISGLIILTIFRLIGIKTGVIKPNTNNRIRRGNSFSDTYGCSCCGGCSSCGGCGGSD